MEVSNHPCCKTSVNRAAPVAAPSRKARSFTPDFVLFEAAEDGGERFWPRLEFGVVGWNSGTVHAGLILKKERALPVNRGSREQAMLA